MTENEADRRRLVPRLISVAAIVILALLCWKPWFMAIIVEDRSVRTAALQDIPDRVDPDFVEFLRNVAERVDQAEVIHLVIPPRSVPAYSWFVYRAEWTLAGYQIHPLHDPNDQLPQGEIEPGAIVVLWNATPAPESVDVLMQQGRGMLARRR